MSWGRGRHWPIAAGLAAAAMSAFSAAIAQTPPSAQPPLALTPNANQAFSGSPASVLLHVPVSDLAPGAAPMRPAIQNPVAGDLMALQRGMNYFIAFNCVGCHAANGGGGMGPALSNRIFIYGAQPANIFLTIYQGRPNGMPAWGDSLTNSIIWDLVSYIQSISNEPTPEWGRTISRAPLSPDIQQVPAGQVTTAQPWSETQPFTSGKKP